MNANVLRKIGYMVLAVMLALSMSVWGLTVHPATASAKSENANVTAFTLKVDGTNFSETYTQARLANTYLNGTSILNTGKLPAEYQNKSGFWNIVQVQNYVTLSDLFAAAGVSNYWKSGAVLEFTVMKELGDGSYTEETYPKYTLSYDDMATQNKFYKYLEQTGGFY